jgi:hypothetical protein
VAHVDVEAERLAPPLQALAHVAVQGPQRRDVQRADAKAVVGCRQRVEDG